MDLSKSKSLFVLLTASLLLLVIVKVTKLADRAIVENITATAKTPDTAPKPARQETSGEAPSNIQVVVLALRSDGFEPAELSLSRGEYLFVVRNRTGLDQVNFRLIRGNSEHVAQAKGVDRRRDWKQRVQLTPGKYLLTETAHSDWTCAITIAP